MKRVLRRMFLFGAIATVVVTVVLILGPLFHSKLVPVVQASTVHPLVTTCSLNSSPFNNHKFAGSWVGSFGNPSTPYDAQAWALFDGSGNFTGAVTISQLGSPATTYNITDGTYTVNSAPVGTTCIANVNTGLGLTFIVIGNPANGGSTSFAETDGTSLSAFVLPEVQ